MVGHEGAGGHRERCLGTLHEADAGQIGRDGGSSSGRTALRPGPAQFGDESAELRATEPESDFGRFGEIAHDGKAATMTAPGLVDPHAALRRAGDGLFGHAVAVVLDGADEESGRASFRANVCPYVWN